MNWVGGSRTRVLIKQEKRKQKEYFEKKRLKSKMKSLGVLSPVKNSTVSLDLLNLYVVNQISCQKKTPGKTMRKPIHVNMNGDIKMPLRNRDLELPMSPPRVPSNLCIDDIGNKIPYQRLGSSEEIGPAQLSNVNYSNSLVSKLNESQGALSPSYKTAQFGALFERLNSPGNRNFLTRRPMSEDCASMDKRRHSDFIIENRSMQHIWGENRKNVSNFFEVVNQPAPSLLPENFDSFINENVINLLSVDQQSIKKPFVKYDYDKDICAVTTSEGNHSSDRCIGSIFTDPVLTFNSSNFNETNYQPNKNDQKEYNSNEGNNPSTSFEKDCYLASSEKKGKSERDYQEKTSQRKILNYPVNSMTDTLLEELHSKKSLDFGLGKILMEEGSLYPVKGTPTSTKKTCQYNNLESSRSSQSSSYSPRPTDSCFSSSSEMPSEDEDQTLQQIEDSRGRSIKTEDTANNFYLERMAEFPYDRIIKDNARIHKPSESSHQFSMKNKTGQLSQCQSNSIHALHNRLSDDCLLQSVRCDVWVQTDSAPVMKDKLDAAIQCDIISECKCRSDVSSLCIVERSLENVKGDTTGGQDSLKNS